MKSVETQRLKLAQYGELQESDIHEKMKSYVERKQNDKD